MILMAVSGPFIARFAWCLWVNLRGLAQLRRTETPVVSAQRAYAAPLADKPLDAPARALLRELHAATPTT
jgi:hypothetical protein